MIQAKHNGEWLQWSQGRFGTNEVWVCQRLKMAGAKPFGPCGVGITKDEAFATLQECERPKQSAIAAQRAPGW